MRYSFITPQEKHLFYRVTQIWIAYSLITLCIIFLFLGFVSIQREFMLKSATASESERQMLIARITRTREEIERAGVQSRFSTDVAHQNLAVRESLKNLFGLVPDQITLSGIEMGRDSLILKGLTPSKELYLFLLEVPLRSIFYESRADFYQLPNGWFTFVSVSRLREDLPDAK